MRQQNATYHYAFIYASMTKTKVMIVSELQWEVLGEFKLHELADFI